MGRHWLQTILACLIVTVCARPLFGLDCLTEHYDNQRTGDNQNETTLTPTAVQSGNFGKLFSIVLNSEPDGQPLYVANQSIAGGTHNVMYVRDGANGGGTPSYLAAYDADGPVTYLGNPWYWRVQLVANLSAWNTNAPAIDKASNTIFSVVQDKNTGAQYLYALDLSTGANKTGSPVAIKVGTWAGQPVANTIAGTGGGSTGGRLPFDPSQHNCRPALLVDNGTVWIAFSHNSDGGNYHGWVFGYNSSTLAQTTVWCNTPDANAGGIWQTNAGLAADANHNIYFSGGNGSFDANTGGRDYSMCFIKLHPASPLNVDLSTNATVADWFASYDAVGWSNSDLDTGETGVILIPGTNKMVSGGTKYALFHLLEYQNYTSPATNMGHYDTSGTSDHQTNVQSLPTGSGTWDNGQNPTCWVGPSGTYVFLWPPSVSIQSWLYNSSTGKLTASSSNSGQTAGGYTVVTSSSGSNAILWARGNNSVLHAFNPSNLTQEYWNSSAKSSDNLPSTGTWQFPMAINGKVYVPTANSVVVYGMFASAPVFTSVSVSPGTATVIVNSTKSFSATALDQNGNAMVPQPTFTWSVSGGGSINSSGLFTAGSVPSGPFTVTAQATISAVTKSGTASVTVNSNVKVTPPTETVAINTSYTFTATALNGSGNPVVPQPTFTWAVSGGGSINSSGVFTAGAATGGPFTVTASTGGGSSGTASVTVTPSPYGIDTLGALGPYLNNKMPTTIGGTIPATLSAAGAFSNTANLTPTAGLIPYDVNSPLWSDGAIKTRWTALATGTTVPFSSTGEWNWPNGTVFIKHFELGTDDTNSAVRQRLETRILVRDSTGYVYGVTYKWRADNSDADLVAAGGDSEVVTIKTVGGGTRTQTWYFPSQANCLTCHTQVSGGVLGVKSRQLNGNFTYPVSGITDNQLRTWNHLDLFTSSLNEANIPGYPKLNNVSDATASLQQRSRSYLDSNCFACHQPGGVSNSNWDARYDTPLASQGLIDVNPIVSLGISGAKVIASGSVPQSVLAVRIAAIPPNSVTMPPLAKYVVDSVAVTTIDNWINSLLAITTASPLPGGDLIRPYSQTFAVTGGTPGYTWSITGAGTLPAGLSLSAAGELSGTPTATGTANFIVKVVDNVGTSQTKAFALTVSALPSITTASPLPAGSVAASYSLSFAASGGSAPLNWAVTSGTLPTGLSLSAAGALSGTPTAIGTSNFTVSVTDAAGGSANKAFGLTVNNNLVLSTIQITPSNITLSPLATQLFVASALDQFGNPLVPQPVITWNVAGGGTITAGFFTAGTLAGNFSVNASSGSVIGKATVIVDLPPVVVSPPSANPTTIVTNVPETFTAAGSDPSSGTVTYTWNFGDGTSGTGPSAVHTYTSPGNYVVTLTMSNSIGGATISTLNITVTAGGGAAPPATIAMSVSKLHGLAKFTGGGHDSCSITGTIPSLPKLFDPTGKALTLTIQGATVSFTLDSHGRGRAANGTISLKVKPTKRNPTTKKNEFQGGNIVFGAKIQNGTWAATWGLDPKTTAKNVSMNLAATVVLDGTTYVATVTTMYMGKAGVDGSFKK